MSTPLCLLLISLSSNLFLLSSTHPNLKKREINADTLNTVNIIEESVEETENLDTLGDPESCGINGKKIAAIKEAQEAAAKDWPWLAGLLRKADKFHFCGGAVVTTRHILSAAHCVPGVLPERIVIRLGEYDFARDNDSMYLDYNVEKITSHSDYDPGTYENDIAILKLVDQIIYSVYVQPLCLPKPGPRYEGMTCIVAGWGTLFYGGPQSEVLMEVPVPIWDQDDCVHSYTQTIFDTTMCAAGFNGGKDSCQGDSGGPLMCQIEGDKWTTVGIVSWGIKCALKGKPGIYTRVNDYLPWIAPRIKDM